MNQVGVNVNTASSSLLEYISGLNKTVANNIVKYREENGKFTNRKQIKKVPRLGDKTYEQAIGFLRIPDGDEPLDRTSIHPESYQATKQLLGELNATSADIGTEDLSNKLKEVNLTDLKRELEIRENSRWKIL